MINNFENKLLDNYEIVSEYLKDERCLLHKRYIYLILRRKEHILKDKNYKLNYETKLQDIKNKYQVLFNNGFELEQLSLGDKTVNVSRFNYNDLMLDENQNHRKIIFDAYTKEYENGWSKIQHYIMQDSYYLYQYSIWAVIACNIVRRILNNEPGILDKYIKFLSAGNSVSIKEALAYVDIDLKNEE